MAPARATLASVHSSETSARRPSTLANQPDRFASTISSGVVVPASFLLKNLSPRTMSLAAGRFRT